MERCHPLRPTRLDSHPFREEQLDDLRMTGFASFNREEKERLLVWSERP